MLVTVNLEQGGGMGGRFFGASGGGEPAGDRAHGGGHAPDEPRSRKRKGHEDELACDHSLPVNVPFDGARCMHESSGVSPTSVLEETLGVCELEGHAARGEVGVPAAEGACGGGGQRGAHGGGGAVALGERVRPADGPYCRSSGGPRGSTCSTKACVEVGCPEFGTMAVCGRRKVMEDTIAVVPCVGRAPSPASSPASSPCSSGGGAALGGAAGCGGPEQNLHFFGVYDGHGGASAAEHCKERLAFHVSQELVSLEGAEQSHADNITLDGVKEALASAFLKTDAELGADETSKTVGTTAVVALVSDTQVVVANCGDSRAVLCRGGAPVALSRDHKPECPDEHARVKAAGGDILNFHGPRVMGVLAMSRALGDHFLRPFIIPEPEITVTPRLGGDEFVVLASDGLWDVVTNEEACSLVRKCLLRMAGEGRARSVALRMTAAVVVKAALARGSNDNISVVIVDLEEAAPAVGASGADSQADSRM